VRDQGSTAERDGRNQAGKYMVVEVGDRGDAASGSATKTAGSTSCVDPFGRSEPRPWVECAGVTIRDSVLRFEVNGEVLADLIY